MIYLDNAATTFPKPDCVTDAIVDFLKTSAGNPGRGGHALSRKSGEKVFECREELASLINCDSPEQIIFTKNATEAINLAIKGCTKKGDEIIISSMEHNSVLRSSIGLEKDGITVKIARGNSEGFVSSESIENLITDRTRLICIIHASNVVGTVNPIREISAVARKRGVLILVDAAQTGGVLPIDSSLFDMIAFAGHKGLYGPFGTGALYVRKGLVLNPLLEGGTGSMSESALMPDLLPDRFEAGTVNAMGISALCESIKFIKREGVMEKEKELCNFMREQLSAIKGAKLLGNPGVSVCGLLTGEHDCVDIAERLDSEYSIAVRAGLHCSPMAHRTLGTISKGLLRLSAGYFNTKEDITFAADSIQKLMN